MEGDKEFTGRYKSFVFYEIKTGKIYLPLLVCSC